MSASHLMAALIGALLMLAVLAALQLRHHARRHLRERRRRSGTACRHPIVLLHGLGGFDSLELRGTRHDYFRGVRERLVTLGGQIHAFPVGPLASIEQRAAELAEHLTQLDCRRVNLVAHSMGGLDARYAIARLGLDRRVASLTTLGTPHRGTPLADVAHGLLQGKLGLGKLCDRAGLRFDALADLTTARMARFNQEIPDARGVDYGCYLASIKGGFDEVNALLWPTYLYLSRLGENDGVVPVSSQPWGEVMGQISADHWAQIGWARPAASFDVLGFYAELMRELRARGL
jgi:triacylglycerol lipase